MEMTAPWVFEVLGLLVLLAVILWLARRYIFGWMNKTDELNAPGFTLSDLRQLHKSGAMSAEEFERAKARVIQGIQQAAQQKSAASQARKPPASTGR